MSSWFKKDFRITGIKEQVQEETQEEINSHHLLLEDKLQLLISGRDEHTVWRGVATIIGAHLSLLVSQSCRL
ncbi:hypothetical protein E2C01_065148 [Portunus trituberculatus]|uniref:Uncharacterized protein n=1 Tax=Portunus trituberculatus TaxID=210409 RepID=A0A5B7HLR6_PORTR|nr:hypothetical protein [Portunus trituberculatus]